MTIRGGTGAICHTFGVPLVQRIMNNRERVDWRPKGPLVPWQVRGAEKLWVPIDHTDEHFEEFRRTGPDPSVVLNSEAQAGHMVVVSGQQGTGKTTLLHRLVHDLALRLNEGITEKETPPTAGEPWTAHSEDLAPQVRIVPVGGPENRVAQIARDNGEPVTVETVNLRILKRISESMGAEFGAGTTAAMLSRDVYGAFQLLSQALIDAQKALLVILPDFRWVDQDLTQRFYSSCCDNAQTAIVFFVESSGDLSEADLRSALDDVQRSKVTHLRLSGLDAGDWRRFVQVRLDAGIPGPTVRLGEDILHGEAEPWIPETIGALQKILYETTQRALRNHWAVIGAAQWEECTAGFRVLDLDEFRRG